MESDKMLDVTERNATRQYRNEKYKRKERSRHHDELFTKEEVDTMGEQFITKSMEIVKVNLTGLGDTCFGGEMGVLDRGKKLLLYQDGAGEQKGRSQMDLNSKSTTSVNKAEIPGHYILEERKEEQKKVKQSVFTKIKAIANLSAPGTISSDLELIQSLEACPWRVVYVRKATIAFDTTRMAPTLVLSSIEEENQKDRMRFRENRRALRNPRFNKKWSQSHREAEKLKYSLQGKQKRVEEFISIRNKVQCDLFSPVPPTSSPSSLSTDTETINDSETSNGKLASPDQSSSSCSDIIVEPGYVVIQGDFRPRSVALSRLGNLGDMNSSNNATDDKKDEKVSKIILSTRPSPAIVTDEEILDKYRRGNLLSIGEKAGKLTKEYQIFGLSMRVEKFIGSLSVTMEF